MKLVVILLLSTFAHSVFSAVETHERFYRAGDKEVLIQGKVSFLHSQYETEYDDSENSDEDYDGEYAETEFRGDGQFGINESVAIGTSIAYTTNGRKEGMNDYIIFLKGQFNSLTYMAEYLMSFEDGRADTYFTGGNSVQVELGYQFTKGLGALVRYRPEYEVTYKYSDGDTETYDRGADLTVSGHYEFHIRDHIVGVHGGFRRFYSIDSDYNNTDYLTAGTYANFKVAGLEFIPSFEVLYHQDSDSDSDGDYEERATVTYLDFKIRKRF